MLIDTSVWIDWLRRADSHATELLSNALDTESLFLTPVVLQELLQGARGEAQLTALRQRFEALPMLLPTTKTYGDAGSLYARCRWSGYTPRSPHDCLIAQLAIEHQMPLLHDDRDFVLIARIEPSLKLL